MDNFFSNSYLYSNFNVKMSLSKDFIFNNDHKIKIIVFCDNSLVCNSKYKNIYFISSESLKYLEHLNSLKILLKKIRGTFYFAIEISPTTYTKNSQLFKNTFLATLRNNTLNITNDIYNLLGMANSLLLWHKDNLFCGKCGSRNITSDNGHSRICTNNTCDTKIFPRINPAVIMLITYKDKCLLGRQENWPKKMVSALAGFTEHGESIEETVKRETFEEVGIKVNNIKYQHSQPWPFPYNLMLGFRANALQIKLKINYQELENASWYKKEQLLKLINTDYIRLPNKISIAYRLITEWLEE